MADMADLVGFIVGEREDGYYLYACGEHAPADKREPHRAVLRGKSSHDESQNAPNHHRRVDRGVDDPDEAEQLALEAVA